MLSIRKLWKGPKPLCVDNHSNKMWLIQGPFAPQAAAMPCCHVYALFLMPDTIRWWSQAAKMAVQVLAMCDYVHLNPSNSRICRVGVQKCDTVFFFPPISNRGKCQLAIFVRSIYSRSINVHFCFSQSTNCRQRTSCTGNQSHSAETKV